MSMPLRHLPVVQNWDCHGCTNCCREYQVSVTDEERRRILEQGWQDDPEIGDLPLFVQAGPWWRRRHRLNERGNGNCIFLNDQGRCRIHARFGGDAKPLACRLFPFVLIPVGDHWRVSLRFACPSVAANRGGSLKLQEQELSRLAEEYDRRHRPGDKPARTPPLQSGQRPDWPDLLRFAEALLALLQDRRDRVERRWRKCLALAKLCRQARFDRVQGGRLDEFLRLVSSGLDQEVPAEVSQVEPPSWVGRLLFRQALAIYLRKDHGPDRGPALRSRRALLSVAWSFTRGVGPFPRVHARLPEMTFEEMEKPAGPLPEGAEKALERYYTVKVSSFQFCGPTNFGMAFWDGLESLTLTLPMILWLSRVPGFASREQAVVAALQMIDDHFGFNPILGSLRQRYGLGILARRGELAKLIAWYAR